MERWEPTARYLTEHIPGHSFAIVPLGYDQVNKAAERHEVDFVLANPFFYVGLEQFYGAGRIATLKNRYDGEATSRYGGMVFCRAERTDIVHLADLKGKTFMAVERRSFGGWLAVWRELKERGIDPKRDFTSLKFAGRHDAVVYAVLAGEADAGAVRTNTLAHLLQEGRIQADDFHVIHEHGGTQPKLPFTHSTRSYPEWPMAKLKDTSNDLAEKVAAALVTMPPESAAAAAAGCAGWTIPQNYQPVRECLKELRVAPYEDYGRVPPREVLRQYWPWLAALGALAAAVVLFAMRMAALNRKLRDALEGQRSELAEREHAEAKLHKSREEYRTLVNNLPKGLYRNTPGPEGRFLMANPAFAQMFGYDSVEEFLKVRVCDLYLTPREREAFSDKLLSKGRLAAEELRLVKKDGMPIWAAVTAHIVHNEEGGIKYIDGMIEDITERKHAQEALRESEQQYRAVVEDLPVLVCTFRSDGTITFVNETYCRYFGKKSEELVGKSFSMLIPEEDRAFVDSQFGSLTTDRPVVTYEHRVIAADGGVRWQRWTDRAIFDDDGRVVSFESIGEDITEERSLREQLQQAEKLEALGQIAGGVAHDFNNQLVAVMGYADLLKSALAGKPELRGYADMILHASQRSADLAKQFLAFARKGKYESAPVNIHGVIAEVVSLLGRSIDKRITIKQNLEAEPPTAMGDATQLQSAFLNLAINARDAMPKGGELAFGTEVITLDEHYCRDHPYEITPGRYIQVSISDTGVGMDADTQKHIFEPFFTTKKDDRGTGMGLAAVYGTIKNHKGSISVYSEVDRGTTFRIFLPLADDQCKSVSVDTAVLPVVTPASILIVDDEESVRDVIAVMLTSLGHKVVTCHNGAEAVEYYRRAWRNIDLVILDMVMPQLTGGEMFAAMKNINPAIKAILVSGYTVDGEAQDILNNGVLSFIQKPLRLADLSRHVNEALAI
ncbi:MAG: PAS domain S-box protein [Planctomycetes bacterium]|nr:PAS domain S-box protein [Planctomycetota bacterium]